MINQATIIGNLTAKPELKALPSGTNVSNFTLVTNRVYKDKSGQKQEQAEFHRIVVYGKQAENCAQYLIKGQQVGVLGRIQTRSWEQDGQTKYMTEIIAENVYFGRKPQGAQTEAEAPQAHPQDDGNQETIYPDEEISPDDIPFS